jgi:hypothetical protein
MKPISVEFVDVCDSVWVLFRTCTFPPSPSLPLSSSRSKSFVLQTKFWSHYGILDISFYAIQRLGRCSILGEPSVSSWVD